MAEILQGTTPIVRLTLPSSVEYAYIAALEFIVKSGGTTIEKGLSDMTYDSASNRISYTFTQTETLALEANTFAYMQLRFKTMDDAVYGTKVKKVFCRDLMSEDVI